MGGQETVLVVDPDSSSALLTELLSGAGYEVRSVATGVMGLAAIESSRPDIVLLNPHLPDMTALNFCSRLLDHGKRPAIPIIFIGSATPERCARALAAAAADFLNEPFTREEVLVRVRIHLELSRLRRLEPEVAKRRANANSAGVRQHMSGGDHEQGMRTLTDIAPVLTWMSGPDNRVTFYNKGWLAFTGRSLEKESVKGLSESVHPDDRGRVQSAFAAAFEARRDLQIEYRLRRADGEYRWFLDKATPRLEPDGNFAGYLGVCMDITDVEHSEAHNFDRERLESLRLLTRGMAHDFSNLMSSILTTAELAHDQMNEGRSPNEEVRTIQAVASRAVEMLHELMIFAGSDKGTFEPVNVSQIVEDIVLLLKSSIARGAILDFSLPKDLPAVLGNPTRIRQIAMNLVLNASEAIGDRQGMIHISTSRATHVSRRRRTNPRAPDVREYIRLEVSDTGCGMKEEQRARVFDPFFTTKTGGRGLGLAVVQGIVESHGGVINVSSVLGKGTTFEVLLPAIHKAFKEPQTARAAS